MLTENEPGTYRTGMQTVSSPANQPVELQPVGTILCKIATALFPWAQNGQFEYGCGHQ
jgi:hypothetical protein